MFRLIRLYWRIGIMNEMQYRVNFFVQFFQSLIALAGGLIALTLIFSYTNNLGGWSQNELIAIMGIHTFMGGIIKLFIQPNMQRLMQDIEMGDLDYMLTKPEDSQLLISVREIRIWQAVDLILGLILLIYALWQLAATISSIQIFFFIITLFLGSCLLYSLWLMLSTLAFWFIRIGNLIELFNSLYQAGRWPVTIYPSWLRFALTFLVPVAFAITLPAETVTRQISFPFLFQSALLTLFSLFISRKVWFLGLKSYSGASA